MQITKKHIGQYLLLIYMIASLVYIGWTGWENFKIRYIQQSFEQGRQATIEQLITQAENEECQPFSVYTEQKEIQLINTACLQQAETTTEQTIDEPKE